MTLQEYSDEGEKEDFDAPYPFQEEPAEENFVLVELELEEGRHAGSKVHYVGNILNNEENCQYNASCLCMSSKFGCKNNFYFPVNVDISMVTKKLQGVLLPVKGKTQRLASILRFQPPLTSFNMQQGLFFQPCSPFQ